MPDPTDLPGYWDPRSPDYYLAPVLNPGHTHTTGSGDLLAANNLSDVTSPSTALGNLGGVATSEIGAASGVAPLDANSLVPLANLPIAATSLTLTGSGAPSNTLGLNGDYYIDEATGNFYGPKASGAWPAFFATIGYKNRTTYATTLASSTSLTSTASPAALVTSPSLPVGEYLVTFICSVEGTSATSCFTDFAIALGTAVGTITGPPGFSLSQPSSSVEYMTMNGSATCVITVTTAGTVIGEYQTNSSGGMLALAHGTNYNLGANTGIIAVPI